MKVELIAYTPEPEQLIERAGRICFNSQGSDPATFIRKRIAQGHESILEHASASFYFSEISRACSHQIVRHRIASVSQQSQRYTKAEEFGYITPDSVASDKELCGDYEIMMEAIQDMYSAMVKRGVLPEDARFILPNACYTEMVFTANFREWRHFLELRLDSHAQWEIRRLAKNVGVILLQIAPNVFSDFEEQIKAV